VLVGAATIMADMLGEWMYGDVVRGHYCRSLWCLATSRCGCFWLADSAGGVWVKGAIDSGDLGYGAEVTLAGGGVCVCVCVYVCDVCVCVCALLVLESRMWDGYYDGALVSCCAN